MRRLLLIALMAPALAQASTMHVEGTRIVVRDDTGEHTGDALEGAELALGELGTLRIERLARDPDARFPDEVWLMQATLRAPGTEDFVNVCASAPGGDSRMVIYSGYLDPQLRYVADAARFSLSCVSGVEAKCLRWGYLPWGRAPQGGASLAPYFQTCVRTARADYCGDDQATTRDGTAIDLYDTVGVQQRTPDLAGFEFEAGWAPDGAVCVHHARIPENLALDELPARCPRLADAAIGADCDEPHALAEGALILTRSIQRAPVAD